MVWFFDRNGQRLRYEIRRSADGMNYELVLRHPDGKLEVQQTVDPVDLLNRCADRVATLSQEGWKPSS